MSSIKDIARVCGVSVATVSKALNGYKDVGETRRAQIIKTADEMGYQPNVSARALKTKRTYNLGILFSDEAGSGLTHDYFSGILDSLKVTAEECGYDITFVNNNSFRSYYEHCRYRGLEGIVAACIDYSTPEMEELIRGNLPVVTIDYIFEERSSVVSDNIQGMEDLVRYVAGQGIRRIAFIHGLDSFTTRGRLRSFRRVMEEYGLPIPEEYLRQAPYRDSRETGRITGELLDLPQPPECILCPDDFAALGCINEIRKRGLKIPEDISIAGYDGSTISQVLEPKLTTVRQDTRLIGRQAALELIRCIENPGDGKARRILIPAQLIPGASVKRFS